MELYPYQKDGAAWLAGKRTALLADEPGLGKTAQAIVAAAAIEVEFTPKVCVVCPASVVQNWRREFVRFWPKNNDGYQLEVWSYDRVAREPHRVSPDDPIDVLILDEAHYLKNKDAKRTQAIYGKGGLIGRAQHVFALTGTPTPNNPAELYTHLRALAPETIMKRNEHPMSYWEFVGRYCKTYDAGYGPIITGGKNLDKLKEKITPFVLRRKKVDVLQDLPPIRFDLLPLSLRSQRQECTLDEYMQGAVIHAVLASGGDFFEELRKIAPQVASFRRMCGLAKVEPVVQWVKDQLDEGLEKIVLFAYHRDVVHGIIKGLADHKVAFITGETAGNVRQAMIDNFQYGKDCRVFIGQIQAAGTGITLTAASDLLFVESSWVPAENEQAAMRIHRIGQKDACLVRFATLAGSIDEEIAKACARKMEDIREMFD